MNKALAHRSLLAGLASASLWLAGCHNEQADANSSSTPPPSSDTNAPNATSTSTNGSPAVSSTMTSTNDSVNPPNAPKPGTPSPTPATSQ